MDTNAIGMILGPWFDAVSADGALALSDLGLPPGAVVLDVGTGNGNFAIYLASQGYRVVTGEPSADTSRYARKDWAASAKKAGVLDHIRFQDFDASKLPFQPNVFDAVFFYGALHHIDEIVRSDVFREALRVSKQNGAVVFFEPQMKTLQRLWVDDPNHPFAADPSNYLPDASISEHRIEGSLMDIFIYRKSSACPRGQ